MMKSPLDLDRKVEELVSSLDSDYLESFMGAVTPLGSVYLSIFYIVVLYEYGFGQTVFNLSAGLLTLWSLVYLIKHTVKRRRPSPEHHSPLKYSFPSGHTATAFFLAVVLSAVFTEILHVLFLLAASVGTSRIYLERHYLSDAVAGSLLGTTIGIILLTV